MYRFDFSWKFRLFAPQWVSIFALVLVPLFGWSNVIPENWANEQVQPARCGLAFIGDIARSLSPIQEENNYALAQRAYFHRELETPAIGEESPLVMGSKLEDSNED